MPPVKYRELTVKTLYRQLKIGLLQKDEWLVALRMSERRLMSYFKFKQQMTKKIVRAPQLPLLISVHQNT